MKAWMAALVLIGGLAQERAASPVPPAAVRTPVRVRLETALGPIEIEVDGTRAPVTAANFLRYVDRGDYDGGRFHRTVRAGNQPGKTVLIDVIQAGRDPASPRPELPAITLERTSVTGLRHVDGAVSMARDGPDTATSDFFICIGDQPELDFGGHRNPDGQGFAVFGRVVAGMDVARRIHAAPADGQSLTPPVTIRKGRPVR
jgi:peptidyl-prolyl cis-trans isomerase A (cyclophilin A)